jgi:hypothetical protein
MKLTNDCLVVCEKHAEAGVVKTDYGIKCAESGCNWNLLDSEVQLVLQVRKNKESLDLFRIKIEEEGSFLRRINALFRRKDFKLLSFVK